jgi:hypothetical protein
MRRRGLRNRESWLRRRLLILWRQEKDIIRSCLISLTTMMTSMPKLMSKSPKTDRK